MPDLTIAAPRDVDIDPRRLETVYNLLESLARADRLPAAGIAIGRRGRLLEPRFFGRQRPEANSPALRRDALFLIASITKPLTVGAIMLLVERGLITLEDRVAQYVPRFAANGKDMVQIRHLATHTSGLPDMLPNNDQLRAD